VWISSCASCPNCRQLVLPCWLVGAQRRPQGAAGEGCGGELAGAGNGAAGAAAAAAAEAAEAAEARLLVDDAMAAHLMSPVVV
jgi:hypothetical protein